MLGWIRRGDEKDLANTTGVSLWGSFIAPHYFVAFSFNYQELKNSSSRETGQYCQVWPFEAAEP